MKSLGFSDPLSDLYIGGTWRPSADDSRFDVRDPSTDGLIVAVSNATVEDGLAAVGAAYDAGVGWASTAPRERAEVLRRAFELMIDHRDDLAELIVRESGKSWSDATGEVTYAAEFFRWFAEEAVRATGLVQTAPAGDKKILVLLQPVGVSILVTPWNFPAAMATRKIGPALAAGCSVVLKPASDTPLTALAIGALLGEAGVPAGVVNVVPSRRYDVVGAMLDDARTRKLSFTGSTGVGRKLLEQASRTIVNCSMELGGNGPFIVFADADLDSAVEGAMVAKMRNAGESCIAANRFYVEASVADDFGAMLAKAMSALQLGPGLDRENDVGPLINLAARDEVASLVDASVAAGATVLTGGRVPDGPGCYYEPTVLTGVDPADSILDEEIFGPVAPVVAFETEAQAIEMANRTEYGLAAYVYSGDLARGLRVSEAIDAGMVGINRGYISDPAAPFGGTKQSGLGREGGHEGLMEFLEQKYLAVDWSG